MKRFSFLALLVAALVSIYAFAVRGYANASSNARAACSCVDCHCPNCDGVSCSCDVCACESCGCAEKASTAVTARTCCVAASAKLNRAVCGCEVCKCPDCNGQICACVTCECVGCGCANYLAIMLRGAWTIPCTRTLSVWNGARGRRVSFFNITISISENL